MKKIYVLDTNVLIHDPKSIFKFEDNEVVIPFVVVEELDSLKKGHGEIALSARQALRYIDGLRACGKIALGTPLENGGRVRIGQGIDLPEHLSGDNKIIQTALSFLQTDKTARRPSSSTLWEPAGTVQETDPPWDSVVVIVSKDTAVRIKAESLGICAEDYRHDKSTVFREYGRVLAEDDSRNGIKSIRYLREGDQLLRFEGEGRPARVKDGKNLEGLAPKNMEQKCAIDALLNPHIDVVALTGPAGTGKTLLALAAGIHQVTKRSPLYEQVVVARPIIPMGKDIGFLPGDLGDKLNPWMQPIFDNLEVILHTPRDQVKDKQVLSKYKNFQYLIDSGILQIEALTYIRGRSLPQRYFIVDEAQNLRPLDVKTIITRSGEGTKMVFTGDLDQIDTPYLDSTSNGLAYLISRFIQEENFCYLRLKEGVRSRLAEQGAALL